jgi:DNA-binding PadR family transcriptional regulator
MSVPHTLLGLLEPEPTHGYGLKRAYDTHFGRGRSLHIGQVYSTLSRLQRDGLAEAVGVEQGAGPDRKRYAITAAGSAELATWIATPEPAAEHALSGTFLRVTLALLSDRPATEVLDRQRAVHLARMRELTAARRELSTVQQVAVDYELAHLDADMRWMDETAARLDRIRKELRG